MPKKASQWKKWCRIIVIRVKFRIRGDSACVVEYVHHENGGMRVCAPYWKSVPLYDCENHSTMTGTRSIFAVKTKYKSSLLFAIRVTWIPTMNLASIDRVPSLDATNSFIEKKESRAEILPFASQDRFIDFTDDWRTRGSIKENNKEIDRIAIRATCLSAFAMAR